MWGPASVQGGYFSDMNRERGLRNHLNSRIINPFDTCSKIFHPHTVSWQDREAQDTAASAASGRTRSRAGSGGSDPSPGLRRAGTSQLSLSGPRRSPPPPNSHFRAAPPPPRLRLRLLKSQHCPATWTRPRAAAGPAPGGGAEGSRRGARRRLSEPFPPWAAGEGMIADSLCLPSGGGSGEGRRRRAEATVRGCAGGQRGRRCACP